MGRTLNEAALPKLPVPITRDDVLRLLIDGDAPVIFDIGANEGQSTASFIKLFPQATVHAFEPSPKTFKTLEQNLSDKPNVILNQMAIGESEGKSTFHLTSINQMDSLLPMAMDGLYASKDIEHTGTIEVNVTTLDTYAETDGLNRIDFCKIDTQGCSRQVLTGAHELIKAGSIGIFQIELLFSRYYESNESFSEIEALLQPAGYWLYTLLDTDTHQIGRSYLNPRTGETQHVDCLYVHEDYITFT